MFRATNDRVIEMKAKGKKLSKAFDVLLDIGVSEHVVMVALQSHLGGENPSVDFIKGVVFAMENLEGLATAIQETA